MFSESIILVVGGGTEETESITNLLSDHYRVIGVEKPDEALNYVTDEVDLVVSELDSPEFSGLQLMRTWKSQEQRTSFLFITEGSDVSSVVEAMKLGAADCLVKPVNSADLRSAVSRLFHANAGVGGGSDSASEAPDRDENRPSIDIPPGTSLEDLERAAVEQALAQHHGNRTHAAKTLGISVRTLQRKLKAWGMPVVSLQTVHGTSNNFLYMQHHDVHTLPPFSAHCR